jgi:hypothetical protein
MAIARALLATAAAGVFGARAHAASGSAPAAEFSVLRAPGAEDCPDATALRTRVEQITGTSTAARASTEPPLSVEVTFSREGERYRAALRTRGPKEGERFLEDEGPACASLAEAVGVTVALLLDRTPRHDIAAPRPAPPPPPPAATVPGRAFTGWIGVSAGPVFGETPGVSLGFGPALGVEREHWSIELAGTETLSRSVSFASGTVRVGLTSGSLQLCRMIDLAGPSLRAGACARAAAGQYRGDGDGYPMNASVRNPWMAAGGGLRIGGVWGQRLLWGVSGLLLIPVRKQTFSVENAGVAYESAAVGGMLAIELGVRLF